MNELLRRRRALLMQSVPIPAVGDIVCVIDGKKTYVKAADITTAQKADAVGVVFYVDAANRKAYIVGKNDSTGRQWSCTADYEITSIPSASGDYAVKLNNVVQGNLTYTRTTGTKQEFVEQLEAQLVAWAAANSSCKAAKWEARYDADTDKAYLQMWNYDGSENNVSIVDCNLSKLVGIEVEANSTISNSVQFVLFCGMCRDRIYNHCVSNTSSSCNPKTRMDGTTQLYTSIPCSKTYYDGDLGDGLRDNYATYDLYIDACMAALDRRQGILQAKYDGKTQTAVLAAKTIYKSVTTRGNYQTIPKYPAANFAANYSAGKAGFMAGDWWLPDMWELGHLMRNLKRDYSDGINVALNAAFGSGYRINVQSSRWSSCCYSGSFAWFYIRHGYTNNDYFYYSYAHSLISAFNF